MKIDYFDKKTGKTMDLDLGRLSYVSISQDTLFQLCNMFEPDEVGAIVCSFYRSVFGDGYAYESLKKGQRVMLEQMVANTARFACPLFKKMANLKNCKGGKRQHDNTASEPQPRLGLSSIAE